MAEEDERRAAFLRLCNDGPRCPSDDATQQHSATRHTETEPGPGRARQWSWNETGSINLVSLIRSLIGWDPGPRTPNLASTQLPSDIIANR